MNRSVRTVVDRSRFTDARVLRSYAGSAPITRASGTRLVVLPRTVKNQRLAAAGYVWTFAALTASPHARAHYAGAAPPVTTTQPRSATCSIASSASYTTALPPTSPTTLRKPS